MTRQSSDMVVRPICDACNLPVTDHLYRSEEYGTHRDVCYRLVVLRIIWPDGRKRPSVGVTHGSSSEVV